MKENLFKLKKLILLEGLPAESEVWLCTPLCICAPMWWSAGELWQLGCWCLFQNQEEERDRIGGTPTSLRGTIWKILMNIKNVSAEKYISLVQQGPSERCYQQIRKDIGRTFMNDHNFAVSVPQDRLSRCLNAFANSCQENAATSSLGYIQGMNALCGAFLYVLPEVFHHPLCLVTLLIGWCLLLLLLASNRTLLPIFSSFHLWSLWRAQSAHKGIGVRRPRVIPLPPLKRLQRSSTNAHCT